MRTQEVRIDLSGIKYAWLYGMRILLVVLLLSFGACRTGGGGVLLFWPRSLAALDDAAYATRVHAENFDAAARQAASEDLPGAERLFRAMAHAERIQELGYVQAIRRLGGDYSPPARVVVRILTARRSMLRALDVLQQEDDEHSETIAGVLDEGNRYAARLLIRSAAAGNRSRRAVESYLQQEGDLETPVYLVCPRCGYLCDDRHSDPYCPQCHTDSRRFLRF